MTGRTVTMALLFLLVGLISANNEMGAQRSLITSDSCVSYWEACQYDSSCMACENEFQSTADGCLLGGECSDAQHQACCTLGESCENNSLYTTYLECQFREIWPHCESIDFDECSGATGLSWGVSSTVGAAAAVGLLMASFGFVV